MNEEIQDIQETEEIQTIQENEILDTETTDQIFQALNEINTTLVEGFWLVSITIVLTVGFALFWNNVTKW